MRELSSKLSYWLLGGSIYLTGWYYEGATLQLAQMGAISLLLLAGLFSLLSGHTLPKRPSLVEWVFSSAFLFAMLVAWITGNVLSTLYGGMMLFVLAAVALLVRHRDASELVVVFRWSYVALVGTLLLVEPQAFFESLSGSVRHGLGLVRYQPLNMHPNLSGLVYGGGALLFFQRFLAVQKRSQKAFALAIMLICFFVLLAASARASMLALAFTGATGVSLTVLRGSRRSRMNLMILAFAGLIVIVVGWAAIKDYLTLILDLDSNTRGVGSGATGRTDIWRAGMELAFAHPVLLFTGRGIRSALPDIIGFPVESSYINLMLEHGLIFGLFITATFVVTAWRALSQGLKPGHPQHQLFMAGLMIVFILVQSIFNRYLIGVGNPFSLLILFLLLRLNLPSFAAPANAAPAFQSGKPLPTPLRSR